MTDFFEAQEKARKNTRQLLVMFIFCVFGVVLSVTLLTWGLLISGGVALRFLEEALLAVARYGDVDLGSSLITFDLLTTVPWKWLAGTATGTFLGIILCCCLRAAELRAHGSVVALDLGGRLLDSRRSNLQEQRLLNIVSEIAIVSGAPIPKVYLLDGEDGINAFAAGLHPSRAAIGVTQGSLKKLKRAELQGLVAHEFSHILAGDMKLNTRLISWIYGLIAVWIVGRGLLGKLGSRHTNRFGYGEYSGFRFLWIFTAVLALGLLAVGSVGVFFARLLQAAILRQREFLADASAVQFTRDPIGIVGALEKASGDKGSIHSSHREEVAHLLFSDCGVFSFGLRTHPPLKVRIKRIQKEWDGEIPEGRMDADAKNLFDSDENGLLMNFQEGSHLNLPRSVDHEVGRQIIKGLKKNSLDSLADKMQAKAMIFALLLSGQKSEERRAHPQLKKHMIGDFPLLVRDWEKELENLHSARKIALIDMALPALKQMSLQEYRLFKKTIWELIRGDSVIDLFEFMLQQAIKRQLENHFSTGSVYQRESLEFKNLKNEIALLLSAFSSLDKESDSAYQAGIDDLNLPVVRIAKEKIDLNELHRALSRIEKATPLTKRSFLQACLRVVTFDSVLTSAEAEMLRLMSDSIACPLPPFSCELGEIA